MRKGWMVIAAAIGLTLLTSACGRYDFGCGEGWGPMMGPGYGGMVMWMIFLAVLIAVVIYWLVRGEKSKTKDRSPDETPIDILKKRYAKGEITKEEFERMKKDLEG
jgi:putative membrane protein